MRVMHREQVKGRVWDSNAKLKLLEDAARNGRSWAERHLSYAITIGSRDRLYLAAHTWALSLIDDERKRVLQATSVSGDDARDGSSGLEAGSGTRVERRLRLKYDSSSRTVFTFEGHRLSVQMTRPDPSDWDRAPEQRVIFRCWTRDARDALLAQLRRLVAQDRRPPMLNVAASWGWVERESDLQRPLSSVILAAGQRERITKDLESFLRSEKTYIDHGRPYHRGYLFSGPPGTGKTSLAKALAGHFGLDLWYLPLGDLNADGSLLERVARIGPRSMLLLEDIDVFSASHDRDAEKGSVSLSGLLNALDGVATPHGLVTVMTTNDRERLDPALVRPGRVDVDEVLGLPDEEQASRIFGHVRGFPEGEAASLPYPLRPRGRSAAELVAAYLEWEAQW